MCGVSGSWNRPGDDMETVYNKLVRDRIPDIIRAQGKEPWVHTASDVEQKEKLLDKCIEELGEFRARPSEEEMADIMEVIDALCRFHGFDRGRLELLRLEKREERGGFERRTVLEKVVG